MKDNHLNFRVLLAVFILITLGVYSRPNTVSAISLSPTRFEIRGNPGDTLNEEMLVLNEKKDQETLYSSFANFEAQGESGTPAFVVPKDDLGTWITTQDSVTVGPGQQKTIPFKVSIPKDATPGGHYAVIFWGTAQGGANNTTVGVGAKTGVLVLLSVNGNVKEQAGLLNFNTVNSKFFYNSLPVSFEYRFKNDGGDRVKPVGEITIRDSVFFPADYLNANPSEGNALPNSTRKINVDWVKYERPGDYKAPAGVFSKFWSDVSYQWKNFAVGLYSANLDVAYGSQGIHVKRTAFFFVFPWQLLIVMLVIFIIIFFGGRKLIKHYNKYIIKRARAGIHFPPEAHNG
ncbi:MAG: hypothetical protein KGL67_01760 [Patescibacteria group bacterium]|nr:hypothetical protein [Patescibacteria group bacterium]